jgi:hypothetical protein
MVSEGCPGVEGWTFKWRCVVSFSVFHCTGADPRRPPRARGKDGVLV